MKIQTVFFTLFLFVVAACGSKKENTSSNQLYGATWELEFMSGPRIAFEGLFPDKKPQITFDNSTHQVTGNNGCNGYTATYTLDGGSITFGEPGPSTMMYCGEGEKHFLTMMKKINAYSFHSDGKLNLMIDEVLMMRYKKIDN